MNNKTILKKAIEKAVKNGWKGGKKYVEEFKDTENETLLYIRPEIMLGIIFSHDFAKAFWKEKEHPHAYYNFLKEWQYHLSNMVISEEPLKYLEKFL